MIFLEGEVLSSYPGLPWLWLWSLVGLTLLIKHISTKDPKGKGWIGSQEDVIGVSARWAVDVSSRRWIVLRVRTRSMCGCKSNRFYVFNFCPGVHDIIWCSLELMNLCDRLSLILLRPCFISHIYLPLFSTFLHFFFPFAFIYVCICICVGTCIMVHVWMSEDNFVESLPSFCG